MSEQEDGSTGAQEETKLEFETVGALVRKMEQDYNNGTTNQSKYVQLSQAERINKIDAYDHSMFIGGDKDSLGRKKPFFNISKAHRNIWQRATDIDRKNIKFFATKEADMFLAFLASIKLQEFLRSSDYGRYLNRWGATLAKYGSAVTKYVERDGKLFVNVVPWPRMICDAIDFHSNPQIELLELTASQLRHNKAYDQGKVKDLIANAAKARETMEGTTKDNTNTFFKLYEVHGSLPRSYLTNDPADNDEYVQQMHVITFMDSEENDEKTEMVLASGREKDSPYEKDDLIEEEEQTLGVGAIENLFEAQWAANFSAKKIKDMLEIAAKVFFQTADGNFLGQNAINDIEDGAVLTHAAGQPLTQIATRADSNSHQAHQQAWQSLANQQNGISEAMLGINPPSGTAWRQTQSMLGEAHSLFQLMTENKGLAIERHMIKHVIPHLRKQLDTKKEVGAILDSMQLTKIDSMYIPAEAIRRHNQRAVEATLNGQVADMFNPEQGASQVQAELNKNGNQRFFKPSELDNKTWSEYLDEYLSSDSCKIIVDVTGEQYDKMAASEQLSNALKMFLSATPEQLANPNVKLTFNKLLENTSIVSPVEIASIPQSPPPAPVNKVSESISFKDLPPEGQQQMAAQAGIKIAPPQPAPTAVAAPQPQK